MLQRKLSVASEYSCRPVVMVAQPSLPKRTRRRVPMHAICDRLQYYTPRHCNNPHRENNRVSNSLVPSHPRPAIFAIISSRSTFWRMPGDPHLPSLFGSRASGHCGDCRVMRFRVFRVLSGVWDLRSALTFCSLGCIPRSIAACGTAV